MLSQTRKGSLLSAADITKLGRHSTSLMLRKGCARARARRPILFQPCRCDDRSLSRPSPALSGSGLAATRSRVSGEEKRKHAASPNKTHSYDCQNRDISLIVRDSGGISTHTTVKHLQLHQQGDFLRHLFSSLTRFPCAGSKHRARRTDAPNPTPRHCEHEVSSCRATRGERFHDPYRQPSYRDARSKGIPHSTAQHRRRRSNADNLTETEEEK